MGKVGSKTVHRSLQNADLPNPIYHIHTLSHDGIKRYQEYRRSLGEPVDGSVKFKEMFLKKIDKNKAKVHWRIITLVREPISRAISGLFQDVEQHYPVLIDENGRVKKSHAIELLQEKFGSFDESTDYVCTWFDRELKSVFDIDVFAYPFDHHDGFTIIRDNNIEVLILRLEDLSRSFNNAIAEFLDLEKPIQILEANVGKDKWYSEEYGYVLENLTVPKSVCTRIYSSKYAKQFYCESMRNELIQKWSGRLEE